jgi:hypothetical protein
MCERARHRFANLPLAIAVSEAGCDRRLSALAEFAQPGKGHGAEIEPQAGLSTMLQQMQTGAARCGF